MRRCIWILIFVFLCLVSCQNKKKQTERAVLVMDTVDTVDVEEADSFLYVKPEPLMPAAGDGSFDDFIYVFAADTAFQLSRIVFPLPYYEGDNPLKIEEEDWVHDELFIRQSYYTLLLENEEELEQGLDDSQTSVQVEWVFLKTRKVKRYYFERREGRWMLEAINERPIVRRKRMDFVEFYTRFAQDSIFQCQHIRQPLAFITADPDDDFSIIETTMNVEQWFAFKPVLPEEKLSNIIYGREPSMADRSPYKIIQLKGIGNGFLNMLFFMRESDGDWKLYKFEDTSN